MKTQLKEVSRTQNAVKYELDGLVFWLRNLKENECQVTGRPEPVKDYSIVDFNGNELFKARINELALRLSGISNHMSIVCFDDFKRLINDNEILNFVNEPDKVLQTDVKPAADIVKFMNKIGRFWNKAKKTNPVLSALLDELYVESSNLWYASGVVSICALDAMQGCTDGVYLDCVNEIRLPYLYKGGFIDTLYSYIDAEKAESFDYPEDLLEFLAKLKKERCKNIEVECVKKHSFVYMVRFTRAKVNYVALVVANPPKRYLD
ncbi:MAG: hypothetical protein KatS3mg087_1904 [Patescibacteria group bacterium]|nr:MAG: hypothetical protein KatS3mg087_1904 [Patescibacteria group bacterium]